MLTQLPMKLDTCHPMNQGVLEYLRRGIKMDLPLLLRADQVSDAYYGQGSHPDIVERVWDQLGKELPMDCRCLIYGTPALVHCGQGVVMAICNGTQYNLRLTSAGMQEALKQGARLITRWSTGEVMNASEVLGADWIFGGWLKDEDRWCLEIFKVLDSMA